MRRALALAALLASPALAAAPVRVAAPTPASAAPPVAAPPLTSLELGQSPVLPALGQELLLRAQDDIRAQEQLLPAAVLPAALSVLPSAVGAAVPTLSEPAASERAPSGPRQVLSQRLAEEQRGLAALPASELPEHLGQVFDLAGPRLGHALPEAVPGSGAPSPARERVKVLKRLLGEGPPGWKPFTFRVPGDSWRWAPKAGLEGFLHEKLRLEARWGREPMLSLLGEYFGYLDALLADAGLEAERGELSVLRDSAAEPAEKDRLLDEHLVGLANRLRAELRSIDPSLARRDEAIYMVLARAYKRLEPGETIFDALSDAELARIKAETWADTIWLLDIFEIGKVNRWGEAGGSPYSVRGYRVKAEHGGDAALKAFVARAHRAGLRVMADFIPNHYALDGDMLDAYPEGFLHLAPPQPTAEERADPARLADYKKRILAEAPADQHGWPLYHLVETPAYPEGGARVPKFILVHYPYEWGYKWNDMGQIDYSRPEARAWQLAQTRRLFREFGLDGLRRDMSYFVLNDRFFGHWFSVLGWERATARSDWARAELARAIEGLDERRRALAGSEFLAEMDDAAREEDPAALLIDEAHGSRAEVSRAGSNAVYNKVGLYDEISSRDPERIRASLWEVAFSQWQTGAAALVNFAANQDAFEGNPVDKFGAHLKAMLVNTLLLRPVLVYNGLELMVGRERMLIRDGTVSEDDGRPVQKMIPFDARAWIDWSQKDPALAAFLRAVLAASARIRGLFTGGAMEVLEPVEGSRAVTAWLVSRRDPATGRQKAFLAAANWSLEPGTAWTRFKLGASGLAALGAFAPEPGKRYALKDWAAEGGPAVYEPRSGAELAQGLSVGLPPGGVHLFELEELP